MSRVVKSILLWAVLTLGACTSFDGQFYQQTSGLSLPAQAEVVESVDNAEYLTISALRIVRPALRQLIKTYQFDPATPLSPSQLIGAVYLHQAKPEWPKSAGLFIKSGANGQRHWVYMIDVERGLLWAQVSYPDWAGT